MVVKFSVLFRAGNIIVSQYSGLRSVNYPLHMLSVCTPDKLTAGS